MLGKLMKHEFRATGRIGLPLCGVMAALALIAGMVLRFWDHGVEQSLVKRAGSIVMVLYVLSVFAVAVGIFIILMQSFKRNLLGDEGYLMRVLPVSIHELLLSKLFVALLWFLASGVLIALTVMLMGFISGELRLGDLGELLRLLSEALRHLDVSFWATLVLGWIGGMAFLTLLFYADFTMTQTFSKHKVLYNVMGVVILIVLLRLIFGLNNLLDTHVFQAVYDIGVIGGADGPTSVHVAASRAAWVGIVELYVFDVLLYFLTWGFLKFRPNLE